VKPTETVIAVKARLEIVVQFKPRSLTVGSAGAVRIPDGMLPDG